MRRLLVLILACGCLVLSACNTTPPAQDDGVTEKIPEQTPGEIPEEAPDETPEEAPEETPEETPCETPEEAPGETPEILPDENDGTKPPQIELPPLGV